MFLWDDDSYCSELIYKMFSARFSKDSIPFLTHPMTFNDNLVSHWLVGRLIIKNVIGEFQKEWKELILT